jgi:thioredoxin 1
MEAKRSAKAKFQRSIARGITLVDFNAPWCRPCRQQEPIIQALEAEFAAEAHIRTVNIDDHQDVALHLGIQSIPTIIIYKDGQEISRFVGLQSTDTLVRALRSAIDATVAHAHRPGNNLS